MLFEMKTLSDDENPQNTEVRRQEAAKKGEIRISYLKFPISNFKVCEKYFWHFLTPVRSTRFSVVI